MPINDPVGYWAFEEGTGTTTADASGNGNTGTLSGPPTWTTGKIGSYSLLFAGTEGVQVGSSSSLSIATYTLAAWVKITAGHINDNFSAIIEHDRFGPNWYSLWKSGHGPQFHFRSRNDTVEFTTTISDSIWYHVAATYDNSTGAYVIYLNGAQDGSGTFTIDQSANNAVLSIGQNNVGDEDIFGTIDEVRVYNRVLSSTEISDLYAFTGAAAAPAWGWGPDGAQVIYPRSPRAIGGSPQ